MKCVLLLREDNFILFRNENRILNKRTFFTLGTKDYHQPTDGIIAKGLVARKLPKKRVFILNTTDEFIIVNTYTHINKHNMHIIVGKGMSRLHFIVKLI